MWLATIIINLLSDNISKISYGMCGFTLILSWIFKTVSDVRVCELYISKKELFKRCMQLFDEYTERLYKINTEEEEQ
jgi:hypothetical protein